MGTKSVSRAGRIFAVGLISLAATVALATDASNVVSAISAAESADVLQGQSIMSQATSGLFEGTFDFSMRPEFVGQIQRDEATRSLSRPSSGGEGSPNILFTNLSSLNTVDTFSVGGVKHVGPGNLALFGGYQNWKDWTMNNFDGDSASDESMRFWQIEALYGWKLGDGYLGFGLEHVRGNVDDASDNGSARSESEFSGKYTKLDVGYAQNVGDHAGWSVGAWLSDSDILSEDRFRNSGFRENETYDLGGITVGLRGRYTFNLGDGDGEVSASVRRGTFDLDNPTTFSESIAKFGTINDKVNADDTKHTLYQIGWRYLNRLGEKVDFAYSVNYGYNKLETELKGRETSAGDFVGNFRTFRENQFKDLSIPVGVRFQLTERLRAFAGAGFTYYWDEDTSVDSFTDEGISRSHAEHNHTQTHYATGLRLDFNEHLSGEVGLLHQSSDYSGSNRDTVSNDRFNFQFAFSF
ncbi:MAG: hypothetical protein U0V87_15275 [Acidobacteriota bacterium]